MDLRSLALPDRSFDRGRSLHWIRRPESVEVRKVAPSELFVSSSSVLAFSSSDRTDSLLDSLLSTLSTLPSSLTALDFLSSLLESWEWLEGTMYVRFLRFVFRTRRADSLSFGFSDSLLLHRVSFLLSFFCRSDLTSILVLSTLAAETPVSSKSSSLSRFRLSIHPDFLVSFSLVTWDDYYRLETEDSSFQDVIDSELLPHPVSLFDFEELMPTRPLLLFFPLQPSLTRPLSPTSVL